MEPTYVTVVAKIVVPITGTATKPKNERCQLLDSSTHNSRGQSNTLRSLGAPNTGLYTFTRTE